MNQNSTQPGAAEGAGRHTPGDWEVYRNPGGELEVLANRPGSLCPLICTVNQEQDSEGGRIAVCDGDPVANAHVIAAGPDLLAACRMVEEQIISHMAGAWPGTMSITAKRVGEALRAAIAAAEGTQP